MQLWLAADPSFVHGTGQGSRHLVELLAAFLLTALISFSVRFRAKARACAHRRSS